MLFNSYIFILAFLPLTLIIYFLLGRLPEKNSCNKIFLVLASFVFYGYNHPGYVPIIAGSIVINYLLSQQMLNSNKKALRLALLLIGITGNLGVLFLFKYHDFFAENLNHAFSLHLPLNHWVLPLGISFFTFQQLSYVIDSYTHKVPKYHFLDYSLFVTFFPQLIAGPIVLHSEIVPQFADPKNRHFRSESFAPGLFAFARGLFKKVIVADTFAIAVNAGFGAASSLNTAEAWFVAIGYTLQLYFDFSGYCDMATGIGLMFNIRIPMNFNSPYKSLNIREFWQRWHMTLSRFLTNYIYFPLGGSRKGEARTVFNLLVVWLVTGFWHGITLNFIIWGLSLCFLIICERLFVLKKLPAPLSRFVGRVNVLILIPLTWVVFAISDFDMLGIYFSRLFPFAGSGIAVNQGDFLKNIGIYWTILLPSLLLLIPKVYDFWVNRRNRWIFNILWIILFWACIYSLAGAAGNPFMYFKF